MGGLNYMENLEQIFEETLKEKNDTRVIEIEGLGKRTLAEWEVEVSQALKDEFGNDPEYQRRASQ
jgi:hypothetical protein